MYLNVRNELGHEHHVDLTLPDHLIGNADVTAPGISGFQRWHGSSPFVRPPGRMVSNWPNLIRSHEVRYSSASGARTDILEGQGRANCGYCNSRHGAGLCGGTGANLLN